MNRADIVAYAQAKNDERLGSLPGKLVREVLDFVIDEITETLLAGNPVKLSGFGTFETRDRKTKIGRNPKTGGPLVIPAHRAIIFRPKRNLLQ